MREETYAVEARFGRKLLYQEAKADEHIAKLEDLLSFERESHTLLLAKVQVRRRAFAHRSVLDVVVCVGMFCVGMMVGCWGGVVCDVSSPPTRCFF